MKYIKLFLAIILSFCFVNSLWAKEVNVEATGRAYYEGKDISTAYNSALIDAQVKAIQQGCGLNLSSVVEGKDFTYVTEILKSNSSGRIIKYEEIKREKIDDNNVSVTIKAIVTNSDPKAIIVNSTGYGIVIDNNMSEAQKTALTEAKKQAVEQGCGVSFEAQTKGKNFTEVDEILQSYTKGYISEYEVIEEKAEGNNYIVKIKAYVVKVDNDNISGIGLNIKDNKVISYKGEEKVVSIPKGVYSIESNAFANNENIEEIVLTDEIVSIGNSAFRNCKKLKKINLVDSISYIGAECFFGCSSLDNINIPKGLSTIEIGCFQYCSALSNITIPDNIKEIRDWSFANCFNLSNIALSNGLKQIGKGAFTCLEDKPNEKVNQLIIPSSVEVIGEYAFLCYPNLRELIIEAGVKYIKFGAFANSNNKVNKSLRKLIIPKSVVSVGEFAFASYPNLEELILERGIKEIKQGAFINLDNVPNQSLRKLHIPGTVEKIGVTAFACYSNIEELIIENGVKQIETGAFGNANNTANKTLRKLFIPGSVEVIGTYAFSCYPNIEELIIDYGVKKIGDFAFTNLDFTTNKSLEKLTIPGTVENIGDYAFACYVNLKELNIEQGVKKIGKSAFINIENEQNKSLSKLFIPGTVEIIDEGAFAFYTNIGEITIEEGVKRIAKGAFLSLENNSLHKLSMPNSLEIIEEYAFTFYNKLSIVSLSKRTKVQEDSFKECPNIKIEYRD